MLSKKNGKMMVLIISIMVLAVLLPAGLAGAQNGTAVNEDINKAVGDLEIPRGTIVNGDVTLNIGELRVLGIVNGNVNSNMGKVTIDGDVNGNVETNMGEVIISGNVSGNVKTRMGEIVVDGSVGGNLESDLGEARVGGSVGGDIGSGFGELRITGTVAGNVYSKGGTVIITGIVEGDVMLDQGVVELGPDAIVAGRVIVERGIVRQAETAQVGSVEIGEELSPAEVKDITDDPGYRFEGIDDNFIATVAERIVREVNQGFRDVGFMPHMGRDWNFFRYPFHSYYGSTARGVINILIMFALAALTYTLFPKHVRAAGNAVPAKPGPVIGLGILVAVLALPLMVLLAITLIGIPLIIVEIIFLAALAILGYSGLVLLVGEKIISAASSRQTNPLGAMALGALALGLVAMIPLLGGLVTITLYILAFGAALASRFGTVNYETQVLELPAASGESTEDQQ
jgi:cytoskeletal protein CcmA (bactofilin family)